MDIDHPALLIIDHYDQLHHLDEWMRCALKPWLRAGSHIVLAGHCPPLHRWRLSSDWAHFLCSLELGPLPASTAADFLSAQGVAQHLLPRLVQLTHGHPQAIRLAASAILSDPARVLPEAELVQFMDTMITRSMAGIADAMAREALCRCSLLRRITLPMLAHMVPEAEPPLLFEQLAQLPFVKRAPDGLFLQPMPREILQRRLRCTDPEAFHRARRGLAHQILAAAERDGGVLNARHITDLLYLSDNAAIRSMYFHDGAGRHFVEPALAQDAEAIFAIAARHGGTQQRELAQLWWREAPHCFHVARSCQGRVAGFYIAAAENEISRRLVEEDSAVAAACRHAGNTPPDAGESWLLQRMRYCAEHGAAMSAANSAMCLDIQRSHVARSQRLRRLYSSLDAASGIWAEWHKAGMRTVAGYDHAIDGRRNLLTLLDFGPGLLRGWLASLLDIGGASAQGAPVCIDESARHLLLGRQRIPLSPLELRLMRYFIRHCGTALNRDTLLHDVWGRNYESSSNVVDVVVRALRKKLGVRSDCIETVTRFGYRFQLPGA